MQACRQSLHEYSSCPACESTALTTLVGGMSGVGNCIFIGSLSSVQKITLYGLFSSSKTMYVCLTSLTLTILVRSICVCFVFLGTGETTEAYTVTRCVAGTCAPTCSTPGRSLRDRSSSNYIVSWVFLSTVGAIGMIFPCFMSYVFYPFFA